MRFMKLKLLREMNLYYAMTNMIEKIQKCLTSGFEAPTSEWAILRNGKQDRTVHLAL